MDEYPTDPCRCGHTRNVHDGEAGCFSDLLRNDDGTLDTCECAAFDLDTWAEVTAWARAGMDERTSMPDTEVEALIAKAEEQIRADERARISRWERGTSPVELVEKIFGDFKTFKFEGVVILEICALSGLVLVLLGTAVNVFLAVLNNLMADLVGGIQVTVLEEQLEPAPLFALPEKTENGPVTAVTPSASGE